MTPRDRRLQADFEQVMAAFRDHPRVAVETQGPCPPETYIVTYRVEGLVPPALEGEEPVVSGLHKAKLYLHQGYPREKPKCTMLTPIFHPNFGAYICTSDTWAAGESLVDIIVMIGDMIQYRTYNVHSALNLEAAYWAVEHASRLPLGTVGLYPAEVPASASGLEVAASRDRDDAASRDQDDAASRDYDDDGEDLGIVLLGGTVGPVAGAGDDLEITLHPRET